MKTEQEVKGKKKTERKKMDLERAIAHDGGKEIVF
jgi:hypothetical protein